MEMTDYQSMEQAKLDDIGHDTDALIKMLGSEKMSEGVDMGMLLGMLNDRRSNGDLGGDWLVLFLLLILGGNGGLLGNRDGSSIRDVQGMLMDAINTNGTRQENAIGNLANALNCDVNSIKSALCGIDKDLALTGGDLKAAIQSCCCNLQGAIKDCCCQTNLNIERMGNGIQQGIAGINYNLASQFAAQTNAIQSAFCQQNAYLASEFCAIKQREDAREIAQLRDQLAQERASAQTAVLLNAIRGRDTVSGVLDTTAGTWSGTIS